MKLFASDNFSGVHPKIMKALETANDGHVMAYGDDDITKNAIKEFKKLFGKDVDVSFVYSGTGANIVALRTLLQPFEAVIAPRTAHINVHECGAIEALSGSKIITTDGIDGKLTPKQVQSVLEGVGSEHFSQPKVISITQCTEMGTLYSVKEIHALCAFAHEKGMYVHIDGARIANAVVALGSSVKEMLTDTGVDIISFGGTKNGIMFGEAIVFLNKDLANNIQYFRKQSGQLASKMRYIAAQFLALFEDDLWLKSAQNANNMTNRLYEQVKNMSGVNITAPVETNMIFAQIDPKIIPKLQKKSFFWVENEQANEVRWVTSWDTTEEDVDAFVEILKSELK